MHATGKKVFETLTPAYVVYFHHIVVHDNNIASKILQPNVIKQRNKTNAITMSGQGPKL
jgi:hypothetical protein